MVNILNLNFGRVFNPVLYKILIESLLKCDLAEDAVGWIEIWQNGKAECGSQR